MAQSVTQAANGKKQVVPMMEAVEEQSGQRPEAVLANSGYCLEKDRAHLELAAQPKRLIEAFMAMERQKHG